MYPILARYGPFFLYTYTVLMGLALVAGIGLSAWLEKQDGLKRPGWIDGLLVALVAGLIGGRAGYVWANWPYFQKHTEEIGLVWQGGLSYHGFLLVGLAAFLIWSARAKVPAAGYAGLLVPGLVLSSAIGWLACYFEGCAYGREASFGPLSGDLPDSFGVYELRYQTQLLGVFLCLVTLFIILALRGRLTAGRLFWLALLLLSAGRLLTSLLRGDAIVMVGQLRLDTVWETALVAITLLALVYSMIRRQPGSSKKTR